MGGWIAIWRSTRHNEIYMRAKPFCNFAAWISLLLQANWEDKRDRRGETIKRGELSASERTLAAEWGWTRGKVIRFLNWLEQAEMIVRETDPETDPESIQKRSRIRIVNFEQYQSFKSFSDPAADQTVNGNRSRNRSQHNKDNNKQTTNNNNTPLPPTLEGIRESIEEWLTYKAERRESYKPTGLKILFRELEAMGPEAAKQAIDFSIRSNYTGLVDRKQAQHQQSTSKLQAKHAREAAVLERSMTRDVVESSKDQKLRAYLEKQT